MEAEELGVVLSRASDLHSKIIDAIERAVKVASNYNSPRDPFDPRTISPDSSSPDTPAAAKAQAGGEPNLRHSYADSVFEPYEESLAVDSPDVAKPWQGANSEARSLSAIRDALEVLEEQLEQLHALQQQQRIERDAALTELEESRRVLLRRLKDHQGREWEVVHEALAFAGEPVSEKTAAAATAAAAAALAKAPQAPALEERALVPANGHIEEIPDKKSTAGEVQGASREKKEGPGLVKLLAVGLQQSLRLVVAAAVLGGLAVAKDQAMKWDRRRRMRVKTSPRGEQTALQREIAREKAKCQGGSVVVGMDGIPRCTVRERTVDGPRVRASPDVLFGRG